MSQQFPPQEQPSYPPQQPQYPQPPQGYPPQYMPLAQPPRRRRRRWPWIVGGIIALVIVIIIIAAAASGGKPGTTSGTGSNSTSSGQSTHTIGQVVQSGDWQVTVNKVSTSQGSEFDTPKAGDTFLVINVTLKNTSSSAQTASSFVTFALKDSTGQTYQQDITASGTPDGNVAAGGIVRGNIQYDVPKSVTSFTLQFTPGFDASQLVEWTINE